MEILKIYQEEQILLQHYLIKHLTLLKVLNMTNISIDLHQQFIFFYKTSAGTSIHAQTEISFENQQLEEELHMLIIRKFKKMLNTFIV